MAPEDAGRELVSRRLERRYEVAHATDLSSSADVTVTVSAPPPVNQPPVARVGANLTIDLGGAANLAGLVTDDGFPSGAAVTQQWSKISGPGAVTFVDASAASTTATFSAAGIYVLRLTANDSLLSGFSEVAVEVLPPVDPDAGTTPDPAPIANQPPVVRTGPNLAVTLPANTVTFAASVTDDGLPAGSSLSLHWSKITGPGTVTFADAARAETTATLSAEGTYVLRLTATDG
jgi:hypothetical protein